MSIRIFASIWLILCVIGIYIGWGIQSEFSYEPLGPRPFPVAILSLMALCSLGLLFSKPEHIDWPKPAVLRRLILLIISLVLYAWLFEWLGFSLATGLLTFCMALLFQSTLIAAILSGAVLGPTLFFAFDRLLEVTLPIGSLFS
nr:tripartite tricarboxylate transporter TctB family protein [uncultured Moellerella sp.]